MPDFDIIIGINFLSCYGHEIDYRKKKVQFHLYDGEKFTLREGHVLSLLIKSVKARKTLSKGYMGYLVHDMNKFNESISSL